MPAKAGSKDGKDCKQTWGATSSINNGVASRLSSTMRHPTSPEKFGRSEPGRCIFDPETKSLSIMLDNEERTDTTSDGTRTVTWHKDTHVHFSALSLPLALRSSVLFFFCGFLFASLFVIIYLRVEKLCRCILRAHTKEGGGPQGCL